MYNIVGNNSYFPPDIYVQESFPYSTHRHANFIRPVLRECAYISRSVHAVCTCAEQWRILASAVMVINSSWKWETSYIYITIIYQEAAHPLHVALFDSQLHSLRGYQALIQVGCPKKAILNFK